MRFLALAGIFPAGGCFSDQALVRQYAFPHTATPPPLPGMPSENGLGMLVPLAPPAG